MERQLEIEKSRRHLITEKQIIGSLTLLAEGDINNVVYRKSLIRLLVNKIFLYEDRFTIAFNSSDEEVEITVELLKKIEESFEGKTLCILNKRVDQKVNHLWITP